MKPRSNSYDYHGLEIFYRLENRKGSPSYSLSVYDTWSKQGQYINPVEKMVSVPTKLRGKSEEEILLAIIPKYLKRAFPAPTSKVVSEEEKHARNQFIHHLPLAAIIACDSDAVIAINSWRKGSAADFNKASKWLLENHPRLLLNEVTPEKIAPTLPHSRPYLTNIIVWALLYLFIYETICGHISDNPWIDYRSILQRAQRRTRISGKSYTRLDAFPERDFHKILRVGVLAIKDTSSPVIFAFLLFLTTPLTLEEICALKYSNFAYLNEYNDCLTVHINNVYEKPEGHKNYEFSKIQDSYRQRVFPLPAALKYSFEHLKPLSPDSFLIHHPKSKDRRFPPDQLLKAFQENCFDSREFEHYKNLKPRELVAAVKMTAKSNLLLCGFEEDELSYLLGTRPSSTAGLSYHDFGAEGELARLSLLQDRWLSKYFRCVPGKDDDLSPIYYSDAPPKEWSFDSDEPLILYAHPGSSFVAVVEFNIEPIIDIQEDDDPIELIKPAIILRLNSLKGLSANLSWEDESNDAL